MLRVPELRAKATRQRRMLPTTAAFECPVMAGAAVAVAKAWKKNQVEPLIAVTLKTTMTMRATMTTMEKRTTSPRTTGASPK